MSVLCTTLTALSLTFGVFCQDEADGSKAIALPDDDKAMWDIAPPEPKPEPKAPSFPPVVIRVPAAAPPPPPPPPPPPAPVVKKTQPKPNPYAAAVQAVLNTYEPPKGSFGTDLSKSENPRPPELASLPGSKSGPLDLPAPNTQERYESEGLESGLPVDNARILTTDRYIPGIMETGFNSQLSSASGGEMIIQVSRDVFGYHGRQILIPKGSRLVCEYTSPKKVGETRIGPTCKRIFLGQSRAEILQLTARVGDVQGRAGTSGEVDPQFGKKYGTALILAGISTGVRIGTAAAASRNDASNLGTIMDKGAEELSQKLGDISASVVEQTVNLPDIVTIAQGTRVQIRPAQDWYIQKIGES